MLHPKYFNPVFFDRLNEGMTAIDDYTQQIKSNYTDICKNAYTRQ